MKKSSLLLLLFIFASKVLLAQDPEFSQFFANPMYLNPAMAGTSTKLDNAAGRAVLNYRNQWPSYFGGFKTFCASWDQGYDKIHGGLGAQFIHDITPGNIVIQDEIRGFYSLRSKLGKSGNNILYSGLQLSLCNRSANFRIFDGGGTFPSNDTTGYIPSPITFPNAAIGFVFSNPKFYLGFAIHNIIEPNVSFYMNPDEVIPRRYTLHWGYNFHNEGSKWSIQPQALYMQQRKFTQLEIGSTFNYKVVQAGLWFRQTFGQYNNADAAIFHLGFQNDHFRILYSYDMTVSDGRSAIPNSHEVSLSYHWKTKQKKYCGNPLIF